MRTVLALTSAVLVFAGCSSNNPAPDAANRVDLNIGHCWIEPVEFQGTTFGVVPGDQFGGAGRTSELYTGSGTVEAVAGSGLIYRDDSGSKLRLITPAPELSDPGDPKTWCR